MIKLLALIFIIFCFIMAGIAEFAKPIFAGHFDRLGDFTTIQALTAYSLTAILSTACAIPMAGLVIGAAGFLFGPIQGAMLGAPCFTIGSFLNFLFVRKYLRQYVSRKFGPQVEKINMSMDKHGPKYLFLLRLSPFPPNAVTNFAMGMTRISAFNFFWITLFGILPASFLYCYLGSKVASMNLF
jgi:uncharacterized membrane protein YdjX (TVP38/TMEM64 family)